MPLPKAEDAARLPSSLKANLAAEEKKERGEKLSLKRKAKEKEDTVAISLSPIRASAFNTFEDFCIQIRRQDRTIKRYAIMEALLYSLEDEAVMQAVIARLEGDQ